MNRCILIILFFFCSSFFAIGQDIPIKIDDTFRVGSDTPMKPIEVVVGQKFNITMEANPTTGYKWELARPLDQRVVEFMANQYIAAEPRRGGSGGEEIWTFKGVGEGSAKITLQYIRPWEKPISPVKSITIEINVGQ